MELTLLQLDPPGFDVGRERARRKAEVLAREIELRDATERVKTFQREHYAINGTTGQMVPKVAVGIVDNFSVDQEHSKLVRAMSLAHDKFQAALRSHAELSE